VSARLHDTVRLFREGAKARGVKARFRAQYLPGFGLIVAVTELEADDFTVAFLLNGPGAWGLLSPKGTAQWMKMRAAGYAACRVGAPGKPVALLLQPEAVERAKALLPEAA
jgi:hypothetical protein